MQTRDLLQHSKFARMLLLFIVLSATAMVIGRVITLPPRASLGIAPSWGLETSFYQRQPLLRVGIVSSVGDGILTPAQSVLAAISGLSARNATHNVHLSNGTTAFPPFDD